jgi:hypothetical protein
MKKQTFSQKIYSFRIARRRFRNKLSRKLSQEAQLRSIDRAVAERRSFSKNNSLFFDANLSRDQIILPKILSLSDAHEKTVNAIEAIRNAVLVNKKPVMLHFEHVERIDPSAALLLVAEIYRCRHLGVPVGKNAVQGTYPANPDVDLQLTEMGFYKLINVKHLRDAAGLGSTSRPIFLNFMTGTKVEAQIIHQFVEIVEKYEILALNDVARRKLVGALVEAMSNANEHAYKLPTALQSMAQRWWLSASIDITRHEVTVILCDQGVGVPKTLDVSLFEGLQLHIEQSNWLSIFRSRRSDGVAIKAATELFRTGTGQAGRGKGFRDMKAFVDKCADGELAVLSNRGRYHYIGGVDCSRERSESFDDEVRSIGGTIIEWRIRNADTVVMEDD